MGEMFGSKQFRISAMTKWFGVVIEPQSGFNEVDHLIPHIEEFKNIFRTSGTILFRGFKLDLNTMERFSSYFGDRFIGHHATAIGNREKVTETTATVNTGGKEFPWHRELGYAPFAPDILFFFCERPAKIGGETLVTDGCAIIESLSQNSRHSALTSTVRYYYELPQAKWPLALGAQTYAEAELSLRQIAARLSPQEAIAWKVLPASDMFKVRYDAPMTMKTRWGNQSSFCNQVLFHSKTIKLRDDSAIPNELMRELQQNADTYSYPVQWQPSDLVIIDNSRLMHSRGEIVDKERRILVRMCYANF